MSPSISLSVTWQKQFLICRNRTNLWCRSHMYFSTCSFPLYIISKIGLSTIRQFFNTYLFSNVLIMTLNYVCDLFWCRIRKMYILKVYIFFPCINTQQQSKEPFYYTPVISPPHRKQWKTGLYQGSANRCEGYCDSDLNRLAEVILSQYTTVTNRC